MVRAAVFGVVASTALVIGAAIGLRFRLPDQVLAMLLALAAGSLITALAFELFEHSFEQGGAWPAAIGFAVGAAAFTAISAWLDSRVQRRPAGTAGPALLAAVTLDGVPENLALGMLGGAEGGGLVLLVAIFLSNFPESLVGAASMRQQGHSGRYVLGT
ncbi:MAG TPA: ZIP family zinc transporter, partial [Pilimelia sp.]|nr:ZIP family zinc transporter [Pilimelia sp.]